jgi:hypothetical protein
VEPTGDEPWSETPAASTGASVNEHRALSLEQQLELVDRVKSLEAEVAQLRAVGPLTPTEQLDARQQLLKLRGSLPWRVGRVMTIPVRVIDRAVRQARNR